MNLKYFLAASAASVSLVAGLSATPAAAQETTTSIRGSVTGDSGAPVAGATVVITHVPSNTVQTVVSSSDGTFVANGLRAGGPYTVKISADGYESTSVTDVFTGLGSTYNLPVSLASEGQAIVVTATKVKGAGLQVAAASTVLNAEAISQVATVNRDIRDLARRSPLVDIDYGNNRALTFAGKNPRFNLYTIDGVQVNDSYGLNSDGTPTKRGPVPLEAIEQFSASVAPYDISYGLFQGGVINSVLKSGTNKLHGNFFYTYTSDGLSGTKLRGAPVDLKFKNRDWGGEIDGPIVKDRIFFMLAGERVTQNTPFADGPADGGYAAVIPGLTTAEVSQVTDISKNVYSYDPGPIVTSEPQTSEFVTGKLDFVITDRQHLSLTWINAYDVTPTTYDTSGSNSSPQIGLRSHGYSSAERLHAGIARWNAQWTDNFSTEVRAIYKNYKQPADPLMGRGFGMFTICTDPNQTTDSYGNPNISAYNSCESASKVYGTPASPRINLGPDQYRHANVVENEIKGGYIAANLTAGNHDFKMTAEGYQHWVYNLFVPQSLGVWQFDSIADYQNGNASYFKYNNAVTNDPNDGAVNFHYMSYAFGLQDKWQVTPDLNVLLAARYDLWGGSDRPAFNPTFLAREGFPNNYTYSGLGVFQPRMSLDWNASDRLHLTGGFGKFAAGNPDIYLGNSFGNTGVATRTITIQQTAPGVFSGVPSQCPGLGAIALTNVNGQVPDAVKQCLASLPVGTATINALDPNFKIPSEWRGTLSADYKADLGPLGDGWDLGADFFYTKTIHGIGFYDAASVPSGLLAPDGRARYTALDPTFGSNQDIILTNFNKGRSYVGVVRFDKAFRNGLSLGASYTWQDVKDNAPATSSQATSLYKYAAFDDPNLSAYGTSNDQIRWAWKWHVDFDHAFFGDNKTKFALFGTYQAGRPFSYTMSELSSSSRSPSFGTIGNTGNYLLYVPTGTNDPLVSYDSAATQAALDGYINSSVLNKYRGQIAPRNIDRSKARLRLDLHFEQELPTLVGHSKLSLFLDAENFLNLIDSSWGVQEQIGFPYAVPLVKVQCITAATPTGTAGTPSTVSTPCAQYRYSSYSSPNATLMNPVTNSLYLIRIGARIKF